MIEHKTKDGRHVRAYSLPEYIQQARDFRPHDKNVEHHESANLRGDKPDNWNSVWRGGTLAEARDLRDWPAGRAAMAQLDLSDDVFPAPASIRRVRRWGEDGDEFSRDRFDAGRLDCWETRRRQRMPIGSQTVRLTAEGCANHTIKAPDLIWAGAAAALLVDRLEGAGYRVEVALTITTDRLDDNGYKCADVIDVKAADEPLNLDALLIALSHPLILRWASFASCMRRPVKVEGSLGRAAPTPAALRGEIHVDKATTREAAECAIRSALATYTKGGAE